MHLSRNLSLILGGCTSLAYLVGSIIPLWSMDKFGRRASLMFSAAGLCFCFVMTSFSYRLVQHHVHMQRLCLCLYSNCSLALDICQYHGGLFILHSCKVWHWQNYRFYPSEISTTRIRARAQAFGGFVNWICVCESDYWLPHWNYVSVLTFTVIVVQVTPTAIDNIGWRTFIIFACFCFAWASQPSPVLISINELN